MLWKFVLLCSKLQPSTSAVSPQRARKAFTHLCCDLYALWWQTCFDEVLFMYFETINLVEKSSLLSRCSAFQSRARFYSIPKVQNPPQFLWLQKHPQAMDDRFIQWHHARLHHCVACYHGDDDDPTAFSRHLDPLQSKHISWKAKNSFKIKYYITGAKLYLLKEKWFDLQAKDSEVKYK